jgi:hypothetical protein
MLLVLSLDQIANAVEPPPYGPWLPLKDSDQDGVKIAFRQYSSGELRYKIENTYPVDVKVNCRFNYVDGSGKPRTESGCGPLTLKAGEVHTDPGWLDFGVGSVDTSSLVAKVTPINGASLEGVAVVEFPKRAVAPVGAPADPYCVVGSKAPGAADGENLAGVLIEVSVDESSQACAVPDAGAPAAQPFPLFTTKTTYHSVTRGGVVTACKPDRKVVFQRCISAAEKAGYPQKNFFSPGTH